MEEIVRCGCTCGCTWGMLADEAGNPCWLCQKGQHQEIRERAGLLLLLQAKITDYARKTTGHGKKACLGAVIDRAKNCGYPVPTYRDWDRIVAEIKATLEAEVKTLPRGIKNLT